MVLQKILLYSYVKRASENRRTTSKVRGATHPSPKPQAPSHKQTPTAVFLFQSSPTDCNAQAQDRHYSQDPRTWVISGALPLPPLPQPSIEPQLKKKTPLYYRNRQPRTPRTPQLPIFQKLGQPDIKPDPLPSLLPSPPLSLLPQHLHIPHPP